MHNGLDNLLSATQIGNLLLDENMEVRRFSKRVCDIFKLLDSDIGRPITHITHHLQNCDPIALIREVQISSQQLEQEVQTQDGRWRLMRIVPYAIGPKTFSGTVVSFVDINLLKLAQESACEMQQLFANVVHSSPALVWMADTSKGCVWFNEPWLAFTGRTMEQELGNGWTEGVHPDDFERCLKIYTESFDQMRPFSMEYRLRRHDGSYRLLIDEGRPRFSPDGSFVGYIGACLDITDKTCPLQQESCLMRQVRVGEKA
jgi:two-component system, chemotaxis family, CheB/CheR fusion protein